MKTFFSTFALATILLSSGAFNAHAGHPIVQVTETEVVIHETPFDKGHHEFQALAGAFFSQNKEETDFNIATAHLRVGWMLSTPHGEGFFRGNCEFLLEAFGGPVVSGPGDGIAGASLLLRYNFVQPDAKLVPYFQLGGGGVYSNAYKDHSQSLLGSAFEFNLQAGFGLRWFCTERCAFTAEFGYIHISNANLADRNRGVNLIGGLVGLSYFF